MTTVHLLHAGYAATRRHSVVLVRDGDALIVADPGMVASRSLHPRPLAALGVAPEDVTHVFLSHHHPDHTINIALFPNAEVVDFWARYKDDLWLDHDGDGYQLAPNAELWLTPGHTAEDASLIVRADDGVYAMTHLWWKEDRTPEIDPLGDDQAASRRAARASWPRPTSSSRATAPRSGSTLTAADRARPARHDVQADVVDDGFADAASATSWTKASRSAGGRRSRWAPRTTVRR